MIQVRESSLLFQTCARCNLGTISIAAFLKNSQGVRDMRVFGKYALVYLLEGSGYYAGPQNKEWQVVAGDLIIVFPDVPHRYGPKKGDFWSEFHIVFDGPIFDLWRKAKLLSDTNPIIHLDPVEYWLNTLKRVLPKTREIKKVDMTQSICRLQLFLAEALDRQGDGSSESPLWFRDTCRIMQSEPDRALNMFEMARNFGLSYEQFRKKFKCLAGVSPGHYRLIYLMNFACLLIHSERLTNKEIAEKLLFCDEFHFAKTFKKIIGMSTREFRIRYAGM